MSTYDIRYTIDENIGAGDKVAHGKEQLRPYNDKNWRFEPCHIIKESFYPPLPLPPFLSYEGEQGETGERAKVVSYNFRHSR
jgi:hypothetical protein